MKEIGENFFDEGTLAVAKNLLGAYLVVESPEGAAIGRIVETEAYLWNDEASHSFRGRTVRNSPMFEEAGTVYVYFIYGSHYCFNITTNKKGIGEAVLIRALEPIQGLELMKKRRGINEIKRLCKGPANLVKAAGIAREDNNTKINRSRIKLLKDEQIPNSKIISAKRIGIVKGSSKKYRFYIKGNGHVSRK